MCLGLLYIGGEFGAMDLGPVGIWLCTASAELTIVSPLASGGDVCCKVRKYIQKIFPKFSISFPKFSISFPKFSIFSMAYQKMPISSGISADPKFALILACSGVKNGGNAVPLPLKTIRRDATKVIFRLQK